MLVTAAALLSISPANAGSPEISPHWTDKPIYIDGNVDDWSGLPTTFLEDKGAVVGLANDSENLYVQIRFRDAMWARVIHRTGITIYLDSKGGKSKDAGIKFVGGPTMSEIREASPRKEDQGQRQNENGRFGREGMNPERMRGRNDTVFTYFNKKGLIDARIGIEGANGPKVAWGIDHGFYVYEFSIPLAKSKVRDYGLGLEPGKKLGFGAEWGGRPEGMRGEGGPHFSGTGFPGEGGGMMGGNDGDEGGRMGRPGERGERPGGEQMQNAFQKQDFWIKTKLAVDNIKSK
jgi:hypothetical protein